MSKESRAARRADNKALDKIFADNEAAYAHSQDMRRRGLDPSQDDNPPMCRVNGPDGTGTMFFAAFFRP